MATKRRKKSKHVKRCACCNKIANGHDVVRVDHCKDYLKKQGFDITYSHFIWEPDLRHPALRPILLVLLLGLLMFPVVSAQYSYTGGFNLDLTQDSNLYLLLASFVFAGVLFYFRQFAFTSLILLAGGFLMIMNGVNLWLSLIPLIASFIIAGFVGGRQG